jgi:hypothetical protein
MSVLLGLFSVVLLVGLLLVAFAKADAARLAQTLRLSGPLALGAVGGGLMLVGRAGIGGLLVSVAFGWYTAGRVRRSAAKTPGRRSTVRTAAVEMELDHDTGRLEGVVLAGRFEGRSLGAMSEAELRSLLEESGVDAESRQLLETYLDSRFAAWREHAQADRGGRQRAAPGSGAMTKEEAYKVLGLETGASAAEVRKAHRSLMQRLHPDVGGSAFLAARINEAKDVLLSDHN